MPVLVLLLQVAATSGAAQAPLGLGQLRLAVWLCSEGVPNGSQIINLRRILLAIKERDQIANDSQIATLAQSPRNTSLTAHIILSQLT
jgi:hypothetical protein